MRKDKLGLYDQNLHDTEEPIKFSVVKRYPSGMPWVPLKSDEVRPNNGKMVFALSVKAEQEQRVRDLIQEIKNTSGLTKRLGRNAWIMEMQSSHNPAIPWKSKG